MKVTFTKITLQMLLFCIATASGLMAAPFSYLNGELKNEDASKKLIASSIFLTQSSYEAAHPFIHYSLAIDIPPRFISDYGPGSITEILNPRLTPRQEKNQAIHRLAAKIGLPSRQISRGMKSVSRDMSFQTRGSHTQFASKFILDWDEVGIRSGITGFRGTDAHMEFSSRYQGILIRKTSNHVDRRIAVELDKVSYVASVPIDELSVSRVLSGLNIFSFFAKE